jgi:hypothetical protein
MTIPEEAGKVASSAVEGLRGNPLCLAVVVLTIVLSVIAYMREREAQANRTQAFTTLIERCMPPEKR